MPEHTQYETLRLLRRGFVMTVTIDHPASRNAMTDTLVGELLDIIDRIGDDKSLRALVLRGANGNFCAGADLKRTVAALAEPGETGLDGIARDNAKAGRLFAAIADLPISTIAVVEGPAFGGGFGMACCCDIVLASPQARFSLSETTLGLIPAQIAPYVIERIGLRHAKRLALTATRFGGAEAVAIGLADRFCETDEAMAVELADVLTGIGRCAREANATTKSLFRSLSSGTAGDFIAKAAENFVNCLRGPEGREGISAFLGKRPAQWVEKP